MILIRILQTYYNTSLKKARTASPSDPEKAVHADFQSVLLVLADLKSVFNLVLLKKSTMV